MKSIAPNGDNSKVGWLLWSRKKVYFFRKKIFSTDGYYTDPEAAAFAEQARTNPEIRVLFSASKDLKKEDMQDVIKYVEFLKSKYQ